VNCYNRLKIIIKRTVISTTIEIIVLSKWNTISLYYKISIVLLMRILFDIFNIFHVIYKMDCSFAHNIISANTAMASFQFEHIEMSIL
jgi:hypothetical protein